MSNNYPASRSPQHVITGLALPPYDYEEHTYTGSNPTTTVYRRGGATGVLVGTVTRTFNASGLLVSQQLVLS